MERARLGDRFVLERVLGSGAAGTVYRARDEKRQAIVALKSLKRVDGVRLYHFKSEFRSLAGLVHRNLVTLYDLQSSDEHWFFTMELIDGVDFLEHVRPYSHLAEESAPLSPDSTGTCDAPGLTATADTVDSQSSSGSSGAGRWSRRHRLLAGAVLDEAKLRAAFAQLVEGVQALHQAGKLHRDLKPSNVLVEVGGRVVVCDFGLVVDVAPTDAAGGDRRILGTPAYMSPEQAAGAALSEASDWYSAGVMLYEALTASIPFEGSVEEMLRDKQREAAMPPGERVPEVPADLGDLCAALLERDPAARPTGDEISARLQPRARRPAPAWAPEQVRNAPFVGRSEHLDSLRKALASSREGSSVAVFVRGRSGMGKTVLVQRFLEEARANGGAVVLEGRCYEREAVPYKALDSLVDSLSTHLLGMSEEERGKCLPYDIEALARLFPVLRRVIAQREEAAAEFTGDAHDLRMRAFAALRYMLRQLAEEQPVILSIDDLQWGDLDSEPFLTALIDHPKRPQALLVAAYRSEEAETSPLLSSLLGSEAAGGGTGDVRFLDVGALHEHEARELVFEVLAQETVSRARTEGILADAKGNPFFVAELARGGFDRGMAADQGWTLDDVLGQRIEGLPEEAKSLLFAACIAGRPMPLSLLRRAAGISDEAAAVTLLDARRLVRTRRVRDAEELEPYHDRVRETATELLTEEQRKACHRSLATALESVSDADPMALVEHWLGAGDSDGAGRFVPDAAERAEEALAFDQAVRYRRLALELLTLRGQGLIDAEVSLGDALANSGRLGDAAGVYLQAAERAEPAQAVALRSLAAEQLLRFGKIGEGLDLTRSVLEEVGVPYPKSKARVIAGILASRAWLRLRGFRFERRATEDCDTALTQRIDVCQALAGGMSFSIPIHGTYFQTRQLLWSLRGGDAYHVAVAFNLEIAFRGLSGVAQRAVVESLYERAATLANEIESKGAYGFAIGARGVAAFLFGDFQEAYEKCLEGARLMRLDSGAGFLWQASFVDIFRVAATMYLGKMRELTTVVPIMLREAVARGDEYLAGSLRRWRTNVAWLALGDPSEARRQLAEGAPKEHSLQFTLTHYYFLLASCQIALYEGDALGAWKQVEAGWRTMQGTMLLRIQSLRIEAPFLVARCALAAAASTTSQADRKHLLGEARAVVKLLRKERTRWSQPCTALVEGTIAAMTGAEERAAESLRAAADGFGSADMSLFAAATRWRLGDLLGGDEGAALAGAARDWLEAEDVRSPEDLMAVFAPGFER